MATPVIGGLSLVPAQWRYQPQPQPIAISMAESARDPGPAYTMSLQLDTLDAGYVADRQSFINTLRARRGLSLFTFWENASRCLFFGIDDRGRPGINLVRVRQPGRRAASTGDTERIYAELTGQPRATFPEPPRLFPH